MNVIILSLSDSLNKFIFAHDIVASSYQSLKYHNSIYASLGLTLCFFPKMTLSEKSLSMGLHFLLVSKTTALNWYYDPK
jgi:hypothetical protein